MSYRCSICTRSVPPGKQRINHTVYRNVIDTAWDEKGERIVKKQRRQIDREIPVCEDCSAELKAGTSLEQMTKKYTPRRLPNKAVQSLNA